MVCMASSGYVTMVHTNKELLNSVKRMYSMIQSYRYIAISLDLYGPIADVQNKRNANP